MIQNISKIGLLFVISVFSYSCSYVTNLYIVNKSESPVAIEYKYSETEHIAIEKPQLYTVSRSEIKDIRKNQSALKHTKGDNLVRCTLEPENAIHIGSTTNFSLKNKQDVAELASNFDYIKVKTGEHITTLYGKELADYMSTVDKHTVILAISQ